MLTEGALLFERAARAIKQPPGAARPAAARAVLNALAKKLRDLACRPGTGLPRHSPRRSPPSSRRTRSATWSPGQPRMPVQVERLRALFGVLVRVLPAL